MKNIFSLLIMSLSCGQVIIIAHHTILWSRLIIARQTSVWFCLIIAGQTSVWFCLLIARQSFWFLSHKLELWTDYTLFSSSRSTFSWNHLIHFSSNNTRYLVNFHVRICCHIWLQINRKSQLKFIICWDNWTSLIYNLL